MNNLHIKGVKPSEFKSNKVKLWKLEFVITDIDVSEYYKKDDNELYAVYSISFMDNDKNFTDTLQIYPNSRKFRELAECTIGSTNVLDLSSLIGRVVIGKMFENEDKSGNKTYNIDYFENSEAMGKMLSFYSNPLPFWDNASIINYIQSDYDEYINDNYKFTLPDWVIAKRNLYMNMDYIKDVVEKLEATGKLKNKKIYHNTESDDQ